MFWAKDLNVTFPMVVQNLADGEHWIRVGLMNIRRSGDWMHFVTKQCKSLHNQAHIVYWCGGCVKCFAKVEKGFRQV